VGFYLAASGQERASRFEAASRSKGDGRVAPYPCPLPRVYHASEDLNREERSVRNIMIMIMIRRIAAITFIRRCFVSSRTFFVCAAHTRILRS